MRHCAGRMAHDIKILWERLKSTAFKLMSYVKGETLAQHGSFSWDLLGQRESVRQSLKSVCLTPNAWELATLIKSYHKLNKSCFILHGAGHLMGNAMLRYYKPHLGSLHNMLILNVFIHWLALVTDNICILCDATSTPLDVSIRCNKPKRQQCYENYLLVAFKSCWKYCKCEWETSIFFDRRVLKLGVCHWENKADTMDAVSVVD